MGKTEKINGSTFGMTQLKSVVYRNLVLEKHGDSPRKIVVYWGLLIGYFMGHISNYHFSDLSWESLMWIV